jgi:hypothetical protein
MASHLAFSAADVGDSQTPDGQLQIGIQLIQQSYSRRVGKSWKPFISEEKEKSA